MLRLVATRMAPRAARAALASPLPPPALRVLPPRALTVAAGARWLSTGAPPPGPAPGPLPPPPQGPPPPPPGASPIMELTDVRQVEQILNASMATPVLLDCYADWCQPCKTLTPKLEAAVRASNGMLLLVKLDVDRPGMEKLVEQLNVKSLPTVLAIHKADIADSIVGALPDAQLEAFLTKVMELGGGAGAAGVDVDALIAQGMAVLDGPSPTAAAAAEPFAAAMRPENHAPPKAKAQAMAGLARCALLEDPPNVTVARELLRRAREEGGNEHAPPEVAAAEARVAMAEAAAGGGGISEARGRVEADPKDIGARRDLAVALFGAGDADGAIAEALHLVKHHREDGEGRELCVKFFEALGPAHPSTVAGRRSLANLMFL